MLFLYTVNIECIMMQYEGVLLTGSPDYVIDPWVTELYHPA